MTDYVPRADIGDSRWNTWVDRHEHGWWFHRTEWLEYALAYTPEARDFSCAVVERETETEGRAHGLVPLVVTPDDEVVAFGGPPLAAPLSFTEGFVMAIKDGAALRPGQELADDVPLPDATLHQETRYTHVVDLLDGDEAAHWARVRKSYHSLTRKAQREYDITVHSHTENWGLIESARLLHIKASGRETRPMRTWVCMSDWMKAGHGVLALARRREGGVLSGFAYVIRYKDWSYWMSGATLDPNVQHGLQWALMNALRCDERTRYYEIGPDADEYDGQKEKGVAFFKSGWGGTRWPVIHVRAERT